MNPSGNLSSLRHSAVRRIGKMRILVGALSMPCSAEEDRAVASVAIDSLNLWAGFLRSYYLSGAMGARTESGGRMTFTSAALPSTQVAIRHAILLAKGYRVRKPIVLRRDEPAWHDKNVVLMLLRKVGASNLPQILAAFSVPNSFSDHLATVRNFYAHRCEETYRKAVNVGVKMGLSVLPILRPTEIMCSSLPKRPQNLVTDWLDEMRSVIGFLCS